MDVLDLLSKHRSIRKFKSDAIDDHLFEKIILAGQASASSSFIQACTIIRITDATKRKDLRELAGHQAYIEDAPEFLVFCEFKLLFPMLPTTSFNPSRGADRTIHHRNGGYSDSGSKHSDCCRICWFRYLLYRGNKE